MTTSSRSFQKFSLIPDRLLVGLLVITLALGVGFRLFELDRKVYWHDEVYTTMRAAGWTRGEIDQELFQNRQFTVGQLQKFQQPKPGSTVADTVQSLAVEDPQHPPFYFLMSRVWMQLFGSSLTASRSLPALLSLLSLPLIAVLAWELFNSHLAALLAAALLALSPFDVLFAQTARQYGLLTTTVIASSWLLLRALRLQTWSSWGLYTLACTLGFYTHPFFGLTLAGQVAYVLLMLWGNLKRWQQVTLRPLLAVGAALLLYAPWLVVLIGNRQRMMATTDWARITVDVLYLVKLWILSFTALFLDLDFGFTNVWTYYLRLPIVAVIAVALYAVCRQTKRSTWLFILTSIVVPFALLVLPDLLMGGKRSAVSRYLLSCFPGVQLAVAYLLSTKLLSAKLFSTKPGGEQWLWRGVLALLLSASVASCTVSALADTWWSKDLSYSNAEVARILNARPNPLIVSDIGDDFTTTGDLISLSYRLRPELRLLLLSRSPDFSLVKGETDVIVFRPSDVVRKAVQQQGWTLKLIYSPGRLWQLELNPTKNVGFV
ncbi:glycosyltransferase family 39 protein [Leptolyngbya sp. FACHB-261]|uniref:glycosyltransferase family 39 protein n=1 Tax=Leptolyngbya sp. FACHB-261 TaxID=2692806 RepID=UPI0016867D97|nr:glycosyltransferase family 39 protein [Leptolyngbya sp. FACHB-261]MBD2102973.1 glycosyltransferase family 39 protein [Leptolyngbya sp. FACHB-261]